MIFHRLLASSNGKVPFRPIIIFPESGEVLFEFDSIEATAFEDSGGVGIHRGTRWQLSTTENFQTITYDSGLQNQNLTMIEVGDMNTEMLTEYFVRVKYYSVIDESSWSEPVPFSTNLFEEPIIDWADSIFDALLFGF